jgi:chromosome segregation ATPase
LCKYKCSCAHHNLASVALQARLDKIAAAERRNAALLAEFDIGDRPQKKALLDEATKVQGKLSEAEAKVGSRIRSRDGLQAERDARLKAIADAEKAAQKMDAATEAKVAELQEQRSSTQRAYADKANSERSCQELGAQINRLKAEAAEGRHELREIKYKIKQLTKKRDELIQQCKEAGIAVEGVGAGAGMGAGMAAGAGAGVAAQEGQGSVAAEPLQEAAWPSLADAGSSPVKAPRGGR